METFRWMSLKRSTVSYNLWVDMYCRMVVRQIYGSEKLGIQVRHRKIYGQGDFVQTHSSGGSVILEEVVETSESLRDAVLVLRSMSAKI